MPSPTQTAIVTTGICQVYRDSCLMAYEIHFEQGDGAKGRGRRFTGESAGQQGAREMLSPSGAPNPGEVVRSSPRPGQVGRWRAPRGGSRETAPGRILQGHPRAQRASDRESVPGTRRPADGAATRASHCRGLAPPPGQGGIDFQHGAIRLPPPAFAFPAADPEGAQRHGGARVALLPIHCRGTGRAASCRYCLLVGQRSQSR